MLYHLHHWQNLHDQLGWLRLFESITFRAAMACLTAFLGSLWLGPMVIRILVAMKAGQPIRSAAVVHKLAELHQGKAGTPTMGGILIVGMVVVSSLLFGRPENPFLQACLVAMVGAAAVGARDDYLKIKRRKSDGLSARGKLALLGAIALLAGGWLAWNPQTGAFVRELHLPFLKAAVWRDMGLVALPFFVVVVVSSSNAVNLTDGLDGLATGCTISTAGAFALIAYAAGTEPVASYLRIPHHPQLAELAVLVAALIGAGFGFLWFNCHPAMVFMGDTGSLGIGAVLGMIAICVKHEVLLVLIGGVFVIEALSVILQVGSFKLRGKRIFKMAPIHHHFELMGWHENQVILRFWMVSVLFALLGLASLKIR